MILRCTASWRLGSVVFGGVRIIMLGPLRIHILPRRDTQE